MSLDFSGAKSFILRLVIYFIAIALIFRFVGTLLEQNIPDMLLSFLENGGSLPELSGDTFSFDLVSEWLTNGVSEVFSGFLSVVIVGSTELRAGTTAGKVATEALKSPLKGIV